MQFTGTSHTIFTHTIVNAMSPLSADNWAFGSNVCSSFFSVRCVNSFNCTVRRFIKHMFIASRAKTM